MPVPGTGSRIATAYVERTEFGYLLGLRPCDRSAIQDVEVVAYGSGRVIWSATLRDGNPARETLLLFEPAAGHDVEGRAPSPPDGLYEASAAGTGVVFPADLPVGSVAYPGADDPVPRMQYFSLPDSGFDC